MGICEGFVFFPDDREILDLTDSDLPKEDWEEYQATLSSYKQVTSLFIQARHLSFLNFESPVFSRIHTFSVVGETSAALILQIVEKMKGLQVLSATHCGLTSLDPFLQLPLRELNLQNNAISEGTLLENYRKIQDGRTIRKTPLSLTLFPQNTKIEDGTQQLADYMFSMLKITLKKGPPENQELVRRIQRLESFDNHLLEELLKKIGEESTPLRKEQLYGEILSHFFEIADVQTKGNCLFEAISLFLEGKTAQELRQDAVNYIRSHAGDFKEFLGDVEEYCNHMQRDRKWGGVPEIRALSEVLQRSIWLFHCDYPLTIEGGVLAPKCDKFGDSFQTNPLYIWHVGGNHYVPLFKKETLPETDWVITQRE